MYKRQLYIVWISYEKIRVFFYQHSTSFISHCSQTWLMLTKKINISNNSLLRSWQEEKKRSLNITKQTFVIAKPHISDGLIDHKDYDPETCFWFAKRLLLEETNYVNLTELKITLIVYCQKQENESSIFSSNFLCFTFFGKKKTKQYQHFVS